MSDMNCFTIEAAMRMIAGTAVSYTHLARWLRLPVRRPWSLLRRFAGPRPGIVHHGFGAAAPKGFDDFDTVRSELLFPVFANVVQEDVAEDEVRYTCLLYTSHKVRVLLSKKVWHCRRRFSRRYSNWLIAEQR